MTFRLALALLPLSAALMAQSSDWIDLLPNESLQGWTRVPIPVIDGVKPKLQWRVDTAQKMLICAGDGQHEWLRFDQELGDYVLRIEWRYTPRSEEPKKYNSGIGIRLSKFGELWVQGQAGVLGGWLFGENLVDGAVKRFNLKDDVKENRVKPIGEWNQYEITVRGDTVTLAINGAVVSEVRGIALRKGYLGLEAEGYEIAFRNIQLKRL